MTDHENDRPDVHDRDVVVVGGGPTGCSAAVFCARAGLDTVVYDRGPSSLQHCAHLENYPGFPRGVDVETFTDLLHDHVRHVGGRLVSDLVESVDPLDGEDRGFEVHLQEGERRTARRVIAATRYGGDYLRGLDDEAIFETVERHGETQSVVDRSYADDDGSTPIDGLYVAAPSDAADSQAVIAAGRGARVAKRVVEDGRRADGWWDDVATRRDWLRNADEMDDRWSDAAHLREWFDERFAADAPVDVESERYRRVREAYVEDRLARTTTDAAVERREDDGHRALAEHVDPAAVLDAVDEQRLNEALDTSALVAAVDPAAIVEHLDEATLLAEIDDATIREHLARSGGRAGPSATAGETESPRPTER